MTPSPDAFLAAAVICTLTIGSGLVKLAFMLAEIRGQVRHNGGSSLKDDAQKGAQAAVRAEVIADEARTQATGLRLTVDRMDGRLEEGARRVELRLAGLDDHLKSTRELLEAHVKQAAANESVWRAYEIAKGDTPPPATMS